MASHYTPATLGRALLLLGALLAAPTAGAQVMSDLLAQPVSDELSAPFATATRGGGGVFVNEQNDDFNSNGLCSIREAVQAANTNTAVDGCTDASGAYNLITVPAGTYLLDRVGANEDANQSGDLDILEVVTIVGVGRPVLDGNGTDRIFDVRAAGAFSVLDGDMLITNGEADNGGGIRNINGTGLRVGASAGTGVIEIRDNRAVGDAGSGGGIYSVGNLRIARAVISGNRANRAGGGIEYEFNSTGPNPTADLRDFSLIDNNTGVAPATAAPGNGGGLHVTGTTIVQIVSVTATGNVAALEGGGLWNGPGRMNFFGTNVISGNTASGDAADNGGGGLYNDGGVLQVSGTVSDNVADGDAGSGGGILNNGGTLLLVNAVTIENNEAVRAGGGIETAGGSVLVLGGDANPVLRGNDVSPLGDLGVAPGNGGGLHAGGEAIVTWTGGLVTGNAAIEGGGLWASAATTMTISDGPLGAAVISGNAALGTDADMGGGGIYNDGGEVSIDGATITGNTATEGSGSGGGILNGGDEPGTLDVFGATISNNVANRAGGGIEDRGGVTTLTKTVLRENVVNTSPGNGGGFHGGGDADVTITGSFVNSNQAGSEGGGLWISGDGTLTVTTTIVSGNSAAGAEAENGGGGLYNDGGSLTLVDATLDGNTATGAAGSGGGILNNGGMLSVTGGVISNGSAMRAGGGIETAGGTVTIDGTAFRSNDAGESPGNGGGFHAGGEATLTFTDAVFESNSAVEGGGFWISGASVLTATGLEVFDNTASGADAAQGGGGFYNESGEATISDSEFRTNAATGAAGSGGAILNNAGMVTVRSTDFTGNTSNRAGGAIEDRADGPTEDWILSLTDILFDGNDAGAAPGNGGALHVTGPGTVTIDSSRVVNNMAAGQGGGLWNFGTASMTVTYTTVDGNTSPLGGGLYQQDADGEGVLMFSNGTISANQAGAAGGGVLVDGATVQLTNSTISGNTAPVGAGAASRDGSLLLSSVTVANNAADTRGGGLVNLSPDFGDGDESDDSDADPESLSLDNTIVADNTAPMGANLNGPIESRGFNLFETTDGAMVSMADGAGDDITGVDPGLMPLADNGGPTLTHAIPETSPAVNAGMTELTIDQRGADRIGNADIGAFETGAVMTSSEEGEAGLQFAEGEEMKMSPMSPNPFSNGASMTLAVRDAQTVRVALYDVMGREVGVLHDGMVAGATALDLTIDGRGLASGVYVLIVRGETVQDMQQITVAR